MLLQKDPVPFLASKWQKFYVFLSPSEIQKLFAFWEVEQLYLIGKVQKDEESFSIEKWMELYASFLDAFWSGSFERKKILQEITPAVITKNTTSLYRQEIPEGFLVHMKDPCLLMQEHWFRFSKTDQKIYSMNYTQESLFWGIQFSYPQIFQDPNTKKFYNTSLDGSFKNSTLLVQLRKWMREFTKPVFLQIGEKKHSTLFRIGKEYIKKMENHPHIKEWGKIHVH